jgi:hypothetical protein
LNSNLPEFIVDYQHIEGRYTAPAPKKKQVGSKVVPILDLKLDDKNSLFIDLEVVQRSMVKFYDTTKEGTWIWIDGNCLGSTSCTMDSQNFGPGVGSISHVLYLLLLHVPELSGKPLIFVLKLDEAEILHGKKFKRVSLILMNWALDPEIQKDSSRYFSAQLEQEIWPIACFQVHKESYDVHKWVFGQTKFN